MNNMNLMLLEAVNQLDYIKSSDETVINSTKECSSSGIYPPLVFSILIQQDLCELSFRIVKISSQHYVINAALRGINRTGASQFRKIQLDLTKFSDKSSIIQKTSIIARIQHSLLFPLLNLNSLNLSNMPPMIIFKILGFFEIKDLIKISYQSKVFRSFCEDEYLWKELFIRDCESTSKDQIFTPSNISDPSSITNYKEKYILWYLQTKLISKSKENEIRLGFEYPRHNMFIMQSYAQINPSRILIGDPSLYTPLFRLWRRSRMNGNTIDPIFETPTNFP